MKFNYQARTKTGEIQSGIIEAFSKEAALELLKTSELYITILEEVSPPFYARRIKFFERVSKKEIVAFFRQLAIMFKSEIPLVETLDILAKQTENSSFKEKILEITEKVEGGKSLSKTFSLYPELFSSFCVNMIRSGEASGKLSEVFTYLADHLEKEYHFYRKVQSALIYPGFVLFVFFGVIFLIMFFVIPQLIQLVEQTGGELPIITKIMINLSLFLEKWSLVIILGLIFLTIFFVQYSKTKEGKIFFDKILLKIPFFGDFLRKIYLSRFALNLSTLISAGLPISQSLEITAGVVNNKIYQNIIFQTNERVKMGTPMSAFLKKYPRDIPALFLQMTIVGEKTGRLNLALMSVFDFYQKEVDRTVDNLASILEPILIIFLGLIVGGLIAAVILPIYQIIMRF